MGNSTKTGKKALVHFPYGLLEEVEALARQEHRNRSDLIREATRRYIENAKRTKSTLALESSGKAWTKEDFYDEAKLRDRIRG